MVFGKYEGSGSLIRVGALLLWEQIEALAAIISSIARSVGAGTVVDVGAGQVHLYLFLLLLLSFFELAQIHLFRIFLIRTTNRV